MLSAANPDPVSAQTLGQATNFLTVGENLFSVAIGAALRTVRTGPRGARFRATDGLAAGLGIRRSRSTPGHGTAAAGRPGGDRRSAMRRK